MTLADTIPSASDDDSGLIARSLTGDREAFGRIVARHQNLICSIAYSATGSVARSEELAQETFLLAWRRLAQLRNPAKLRSWLCAIARNLVSRSAARAAEETSRRTPLLFDTIASERPSPLEAAISREEETIVRQSLLSLPSSYREPLVLFYRERQSVADVAAALELSEEAVRQRLSRGRRLLRDQVEALLDRALSRSAPGPTFTAAVVAALPAIKLSASAAAVGASAAKGSFLAKAASLAGLSGSLLGVTAGLLGGWAGMRAAVRAARTKRERRLLIVSGRILFGWMVAFCLTFPVAIYEMILHNHRHPLATVCCLAGVVCTYVVGLVAGVLWINLQLRRVRMEDARILPPAVADRFEYRSRISLLGLPLVHVCRGRGIDGRLAVARGWVAIGDIAFGLMLAIGGVAVGGISVGGAAAGFFTFGGMALGAVVAGGLGAGIYAIGGVALGRLAFGGCAIAWKAAFGGAALARQFALGGAAVALHANDAAARAFIAGNRFFTGAERSMNNPWIVLLCWSPMLLLFLPALRRKRSTRHTDE